MAVVVGGKQKSLREIPSGVTSQSRYSNALTITINDLLLRSPKNKVITSP